MLSICIGYAQASRKRMIHTIRLWHRNAVTRRALVNMPADRRLDIGKTLSEAHTEAAKPFWRA